ncbi:MAG: ABC transporter ATP-binding protein [Candidatus Kapaibacteriota bacterium]|jgi:Cu-processing system ATP-binding protein
MVDIQNLHKSYGKLQVLKGIDLKIETGKITAIVGPNGSGKTTLIKCMLGLVHFDEGKIQIDSIDISNSILYRELIGYMPQIGRYPENLKAKEIIDLILSLAGKRKSSNLDYLVNLFKFEPHLNKYVKNLSGGTIQKLSVILAFLFNSKLFILDEPTAGLDPIATADLKNLILQKRNEGATFAVVSHQLTEVESYADNLVFILEGRIVINSPVKVFIQQMQKQSLEEAVIDYLKGVG